MSGAISDCVDNSLAEARVRTCRVHVPREAERHHGVEGAAPATTQLEDVQRLPLGDAIVDFCVHVVYLPARQGMSPSLGAERLVCSSEDLNDLSKVSIPPM